MKKRLIAFLLVLIMVLGMLPVSAMAASNSTVVLHPSVNSTVTGVKVKVGDTISGHTVSTISGYDITVDLGTYNVNNGTFKLPYAKDIWEGVDNNKVDYISWAGGGSNKRSEGGSALLANGKNTAYYYFKGATPTRYTYHLIHEFNYVGGTRWDIMATTAAESYQIDVNKGKPTRDRYKFDGWADEANATTATYFGGELITLTKDNPTKTIYAVWKPIFELHYNANGGTGAPDSQTYTSFSATSTQATFTIRDQIPTKDGYTFKGWADSAAATTAQYQPGGTIAVNHADSPKTIYAVWECSHVKDNDGNCTVPGCTHPDSCCPKPEDPKPDVIPEPNPDDDNPNSPFHVWVKCITPNSGHSSGFLPISYVEGGYTRTWVEGQDTCTFVLDTQKYADFYSGLTNAGGKAHTATVPSLTQVYKYNKETGWQLQSGEYIDTTCGEVTPPTDTFTVTYTDGVDGEVFEDKVFSDLKSGEDTPAFGKDPYRDGYTFAGWEPVVAATVTETVTYVAKWTPVEPTLKGYTFDGWYLDGEEEPFDFGTTITSDITLTAKWEINKYTVTFDSYGGSKVDPQVVEYGLYAQEPEEPTLKGFTFAYWYLDDENEAYDFENTPVTADITLTAKWNINKYTVAFNTDGGTPVPPAQEVEYGLTATEPAAPEKTGYTFDGWYLGDEKYDFSAAVEQNITLTAKWEKKTYKVVAKLYVNGKPAYYQNTDFYTYEVSGLYGEAIDFDTIKAKAVEQAKQIKKASASYTAVILEDHEPNAVCATFGEHQPGQATHYVKVNVKTEENVVIFQSFEGKTDLTKLHTTTAPYGTNVVDFLNGLGLDLDVAGYTLDTDEDGNTNWYKKDSPKWTFGANDTINGWTNVLLKYTITPHNIYAYLRTGDSIGDVLELNEATLNRLGLTKYNTEGFISIGTFVSNTLLTQDEYYGFDEDEAFLDVLAELQTKLVPETGVSLDKVGSKINWSWLYQPSDVDDRIAGYPTEDTDGYQLSGSLLLYGAKLEAGANDVTGMPTAAYGAYLDYFVSGESFNLPAAPTRPGYDFKGWKIGNAVLTAGAAYTVDEDDMVFTAQWEARTDTPYTVEHYLENLDGSYALDTTEPLKGTTDTTVTAAAKSYDNFTYDSTVPGTVASGNIAGDGSLVLKLFYTRNTYDYTVRHIKQLPDGSYDEANAEVETLSGKFEALAAVTAKDYGSHYPTNDADTKQNIKIEKGLTIDVKYDLDEHTLTFETNGGSAINPVTVRHGNAVARPADPTKDKYTFIGWYADPEFTEEYDFATVLEADKTIYAKFELTSTPIGDIYVRYDVLHIKQLPDGTYDLANAEVEHLRALKDTTVTAVIKDYRVTHHVNVNRTLSKLTGTAIQPYMGVDGKPVYTILSVYYDLDFHTLTFDTMGGSKIAPETVRHGLTVAKPKDPVNGGYWFDGWYTDKTYRTPYNFATPLTQDTTIYAKWFLIVLPGVTDKKATPKLNTSDHFAYVQGYPNGTVKPAGNITRAETAAILFRLMDDASRKTYYSTKSGFRDVASGSWYNTYVATLNNAGVITDSSNGYFRPNEAITRAELAAMLAKFSETTGAANYFNDVSAKYWAANAIAICAKLGWITGYPDGTFRPDKNVTRAELMAMINRATGRAPKSADAFLPGMKTWIDNTSDKWYYLDVQEATNSHSYTVKGSETWTALTSDPNWSLYE